MPNPSPERISVRTPPPSAEIESGPTPNFSDVFVGSAAEFLAPQVPWRELEIQQAPLETASAVQGQVGQHVAAMEIEDEIDANLGSSCGYLKRDLRLIYAYQITSIFLSGTSISATKAVSAWWQQTVCLHQPLSVEHQASGQAVLQDRNLRDGYSLHSLDSPTLRCSTLALISNSRPICLGFNCNSLSSSWVCMTSSSSIPSPSTDGKYRRENPRC